ncbi:MAG TPA: glycosyltransferase, partial [Bryobacteraceae bacterium]|nr:glycosyltransferase [Bryobacteraceae bacterium]
DMVVCPTHAMLRCLETQYAGAIKLARVVSNGRDRALFRHGAKEPFILSVGRLWDEAKNLRTLEQAAARLPWPVYAAGDEQHPGGGTRKWGEVRRLGKLNAAMLANHYARAAIYTLPALYEPFGLSVLEAAWSGCALVLGDIPSLRENWEGAAVFVPPRDAGRLAAAIEELIESPLARARWSNAARVRARSFTPERMAAGYRAAYAAVSHREALCAS